MPSSDVIPNGLATASCINIPDVVIGGDTLIIRSDKNVLNGEFLAYSIKLHRNQIMKLVADTTVYHLYAGELKNFEFKSPPIEEQSLIAEVLSDMDAEFEALEKQQGKLRKG